MNMHGTMRVLCCIIVAVRKSVPAFTCLYPPLDIGFLRRFGNQQFLQNGKYQFGTPCMFTVRFVCLAVCIVCLDV